MYYFKIKIVIFLLISFFNCKFEQLIFNLHKLWKVIQIIQA